ncbi:hypothetical protein QN277_000145 [Acacia crassicarpa]|uniref:Uncharacterized protein n=1 Tax=Acacia crassicarpa TaxID=499986 RepID=A0AAE1TFR8_9FABA|nr:hypothetical protein QN277_000145 [Acacia crassicarpa]
MTESQEEHVLTVAAAETASFWTDEKHVQFLKSIEASFVTAMFENSYSSIHRLRRQLLDASESMTDLNPHRAASVNHTVSGMGVRSRSMKRRRSMRRRSSQAFNSLQDQVVPQIGNEQHDLTDDPEQASTVE